MVDLILYNGKLQTQFAGKPHATALAIRSNRILEVGSDPEVRRPGRRAYPTDRPDGPPGPARDDGFSFSLLRLGSWPQAAGACRSGFAGGFTGSCCPGRRPKYPPAAGSSGRVGPRFAGRYTRLPTRTDLDPQTPAHPVILWRSDGHLAVANSLALKAANIELKQQIHRQGLIDRDASGQPTGVLRDLAINLVREVIPLPAEDEIVAGNARWNYCIASIGVDWSP